MQEENRVKYLRYLIKLFFKRESTLVIMMYQCRLMILWSVSGVYRHMSFKLIRKEERPLTTFSLTFIDPFTWVFVLLTQEVGALSVSLSTVLILAAVRPCNQGSPPGCSYLLCEVGMGCSGRKGSSWEAGWDSKVSSNGNPARDIPQLGISRRQHLSQRGQPCLALSRRHGWGQ